MFWVPPIKFGFIQKLTVCAAPRPGSVAAGIVAVPFEPLKTTDAGFSKPNVAPAGVDQVVPADERVPLLPLPVKS